MINGQTELLSGLGPDDVAAVTADLSEMEDALGIRIDGVLGQSFLEGRVVRIDYPDRVVEFPARAVPAGREQRGVVPLLAAEPQRPEPVRGQQRACAVLVPVVAPRRLAPLRQEPAGGVRPRAAVPGAALRSPSVASSGASRSAPSAR